MSDKRYEANIIRATAVEPANSLESTSAPGVWSIDEVVELKKKDKWPTVGNVVTNVEELFSTFMYTGNAATQTIDNGIALADGLGGGTSTEFTYGDGLSKLFSADGFASDSKTFTLSLWFYWTGNSSQTMFSTPVFTVQINQPSGNVVTIGGYSDSYATILTYSSTNAVVKNQFNHLLISIDMSDTSKRHVYLNDASFAGSYSTYTDTNIGFGVAGTGYVTSNWSGKLAHVFFDTTYRDFSVTSNRRTFIDANGGSTPVSTLSALNPVAYFPMTTDYAVGKNLGNTGDYTVAGSPTIVTSGTEYQSNYGQGGLVWLKGRGSGGFSNYLFDTARGVTKYVRSNETNAEGTDSDSLTSFNSHGFTIGSSNITNYNTYQFVSWTFRKHVRFFDIVQYTGNATNRTISHNLGSVPGMIIIKDLSGTGAWAVYHRSVNNETNPENYVLTLNTTAGDATGVWNSTAPTSSVFSVGTDGTVNENGRNFVAYLFAHNNNDGGFGPDRDEDIIKCGHFETDGSEDATIELGFEPQWVLFKRYNSSSGGDWNIYDTERGMHGDFYSQAALLKANDNDAESATTNRISVTSTGFKIDDYGSNRPFIYVAIRRPQAVPTAGIDVFKAATYQSAGDTTIVNLGFSPDFNINTQGRGTSNSSPKYTLTRLLGPKYLQTNTTGAEASGTITYWNRESNFINLETSWWGAGATDVISWSWKRARGYFDVIAYRGTGSARDLSHNLGVIPEMYWIKARDESGRNWIVYVNIGGTYKELSLNGTGAAGTASSIGGDPTASVIKLGTTFNENRSGYDYAAYLFATVAGVSKVGTYDGDNNSTQTINCGFTSGARFVLLKNTSGSDSWYLFDSVQGIVSGNDPFFMLNNTSSQTTNQDLIEPDSSGFIVNNWANGSGTTWLFYAIA